MTTEAYAALGEVAQRQGVSRKAALSMIIEEYVSGPSARVRRDIRGRLEGIVTNCRLQRRESVGRSGADERMTAIERAANEISAMLGDGAAGAQVGRVLILPARRAAMG
jgi:hypothetical protein